MRLCPSRKARWLISWLLRVAVAVAVAHPAVAVAVVAIVHSRLNHLQ
jgi:hypothetical protein